MGNDSQDHDLFNNPELTAQLRDFLAEDLGQGDITGAAIFPLTARMEAIFIAREAMVTAGVDRLAPLIFHLLNPEIDCRAQVADGERVEAGKILLRLAGPARDLLAAERLALNLAQRLSGIASLTAEFVARVAGLPGGIPSGIPGSVSGGLLVGVPEDISEGISGSVRDTGGIQVGTPVAIPVAIMDTRKTTPGLRRLERYAVRMGGGVNHRFNLNDGILIKDNHIAAAGSIAMAVKKVRDFNGPTLKVEVECETLAEVSQALEAGVEIIMLDNMDPPTMARAVSMVGGKAVVEASGGVNLNNVRKIAESGVNRISIGALTHSAPAKDISMEVSMTTPRLKASEAP